MKRSLLISALFAAVSTLAQAGVTPVFTSFGDLGVATFGGTGIPTDPTAIATNQAGTITIGLTAHQRYANPALTNDGAGTYTATAGLNNGLDSVPHSMGATWNYAYYMSVGDMAQLRNFDIDFYIDTDAGAGTDLSAMLHVDVDAQLGASPLNTLQDSSNLAFIPGFNALVAGEYSFLLRITDRLSGEATTSAINVNVVAGQTVPEPGSFALAGLALIGLAAARRRRG